MGLAKNPMILVLAQGDKGKTVAGSALYSINHFFTGKVVEISKYRTNCLYIVDTDTGTELRLFKFLSLEEVDHYFGVYKDTTMFKRLLYNDCTWTQFFSSKVIRALGVKSGS